MQSPINVPIPPTTLISHGMFIERCILFYLPPRNNSIPHLEIIANWRPMVFVGFQKYLTSATSDLKIMTKCRNKSKNNYIKRRNPISYPILREPPESISTIGAVIQK